MARGDSSPGRIQASALRLFARHGVDGTSLQMIAEDLGVTKAAVYHHYRAKEDIVRAVLAPAFDAFDNLLAHVHTRPAARRAEALVDGLAQQAVTHRELYSVVLQDVTAAQLRRESPAHLETFRRLRDSLAGPRPDATSLVRAAVFLSGLIGPAVDPDVSRLDDAELQRAIAAAGRSLLGIAS